MRSSTSKSCVSGPSTCIVMCVPAAPHAALMANYALAGHTNNTCMETYAWASQACTCYPHSASTCLARTQTAKAYGHTARLSVPVYCASCVVHRVLCLCRARP